MATKALDSFGHVLAKEDYGGIATYFTFNAAWQLTAQTKALGQNLAYAYFNTGRMKSITDASLAGGTTLLTSLTAYGYDKNGNKTLEQFSATKSGSGGTTTWFQDATATYDAMNRRTLIDDAVGPSSAFEYDAAGNVRRENASSINPTDTWYDYDALNRVSKVGYMNGGVVGWT